MLVINCAGINDGTPYVDIPLEKWNRVFEVNLTATHQACQVFCACDGCPSGWRMRF
jgi:NAD(P)-dependent dehydrogenase (short-subunit alcohol dehydrogenase family)